MTCLALAVERFKNYGWGDGGAVFSLTPALSRWERGKHSPPFGETQAGFSLSALGFYQIKQRRFLLPAGEGQDEGKRRQAHTTGLSFT